MIRQKSHPNKNRKIKDLETQKLMSVLGEAYSRYAFMRAMGPCKFPNLSDWEQYISDIEKRITRLKAKN